MFFNIKRLSTFMVNRDVYVLYYYVPYMCNVYIQLTEYNLCLSIFVNNIKKTTHFYCVMFHVK